MAIEFTIKEGFRAKAKRFLGRIFNPAKDPVLVGLVNAKVDEVTSKIPPLTDFNKPPTPYWERQTGLITEKHGVKIHSQDVRNSWVVEESGKGEVRVASDAIYAGVVYGPFQSWFHDANGWPNMVEELETVFSVTDNNDFDRYIEGLREAFK